MMRTLKHVLVAGVVTTVAACGTTVPGAGTGQALPGTQPAGGGLGPAPATAGDQTLPGGAPLPGAAPGSRAAGPAIIGGPEAPGAAADGAASVTPPAGGAAPPAGASGRGFTAKEIFIGYATANSAAEVFASAGINGVELGNQEAQAKALAEDLNKRGGIAGRKVVVNFYDFGSDSLTNPDAAAAAACIRWTEDRPVFAAVNVIALGTGDNQLNACLAKHATINVSMAPQIRPATVYAKYAPYLYAPANIAMDRFVPAWLRRAAASNYFAKWDTAAGQAGAAPVKVGILSVAGVYGADFTRAVKSELRRQGVVVGSEFESSGDLSRNSSEMNAAVLQFRNAGVTHVVTAQSMEPFAQAAESQRYRPRYVLSSFHNPQFAQGIAPAAQLAGAVAAGWAPTLDVDSNHDPGPISDADKHCRKVMQDAGQDTSQHLAYSLMSTACDGFNFVATMVAAGGLSPAGVRQAAAQTQSLPSAHTFHISFPSDRVDGVSVMRDSSFRGDCNCFVYTSSTNHPV